MLRICSAGVKDDSTSCRRAHYAVAGADKQPYSRSHRMQSLPDWPARSFEICSVETTGNRHEEHRKHTKLSMHPTESFQWKGRQWYVESVFSCRFMLKFTVLSYSGRLQRSQRCRTPPGIPSKLRWLNFQALGASTRGNVFARSLISLQIQESAAYEDLAM